MRYQGFVVLFLVIIGIGCFPVAAQTWEVGMSVGGAGYIGDLNPIHPVKVSGIHGGAFVKRNFDAYFGLSAQYNYGKIRANDATSSNPYFRERNLSFKTSLNEASLILDFNFFDYISGGGGRKLSPYLFVGAGIVVFEPKADYEGKEYRLSLYTTEGRENAYTKYVMTIPYGAGLRYNIKDNFNIFSQIGYRHAFTDYLDDVSKTYPAASDFSAVYGDPVKSMELSDRSIGKIGTPGTQRGDFRKRDTYMFVGIGISYTFVSSICF